MIPRLIIILFSVLLSSQFLAQTVEAIDWNSYLDARINVINLATFDNRYEGVKGSPYLSEDWTSATLQLKNNVHVDDNFEVLLDVYSKSLFLKQKTGQIIQLDLIKLDGMILKEESRIRQFLILPNQDIKGKDGPAICEVLYANEEMDFLKYHHKGFKEANYQGAYATGEKYDEFTDTEEYYIRIDGNYNRIRLNKGSMSKLFPDLKNEIRDLLKGGELNLSDEGDFVEFLKLLYSD